MAVGDALRIPIRGAAYRLHSALYTTAGALLTGLTGLTSLITKDDGSATPGGTPIEIASNSGMIYLDLTATEMTADVVGVRLFATNTNASHTVHYFPTYRLALTRPFTAQAGAAGSITLDAGASASDDQYNGLWILPKSGTGLGQARQIYDYNGSTKVATVMPNWTTAPASDTVCDLGTPYSAFQTGNLATVQNVVDATFNEAMSAHTTAGTYGKELRRSLDLQMKRNTPYTNFQFWMISSADHISPITGRSVTARRKRDANAWEPCSNSVAEGGEGSYLINFSSDDLNGTDILISFAAPGADVSRYKIVTQT
jgi:hypothetical protein